MRESRSSGSVEGVVSDHDPYSDSGHYTLALRVFVPRQRASLALGLERGNEIGASPIEQRCILRKFVLKDFLLRSCELPIAGLGGFGYARQFEMRVGEARGVQRVLEPRASGDSRGIAPVVLNLHEGTIQIFGCGVVDATRRQRTRRGGIQLLRGFLKIGDALTEAAEI